MIENKIKYKHLLVSKDKSIKDVMREIDINGLNIVFLIDEKQKLLGVVTDAGLSFCGECDHSSLKGIVYD